ncbi:phosphonate ABC transporter, permease protein PhnE [Ornithinibacillus sp. BX22]|uniref:Phosphonate ABC transporter, permease protein PhnE n=1 Tax=Ornithinibacillus hominis TaxID=2763055 RepID=A0A923L8R7_9BACI|nr:phosphonate ABC transporter, permease protein PhnE [Ornithinibacillus hominis]
MKLKDTVHFQWYKHLFIFFILFVFLQASIKVTGADFLAVVTNSGQMSDFLSRFLKPEFSYLPTLMMPLVKTLQMSILGTFIGVIFAIPVSFLATTFVTQNLLVATIFRFFLGVIRTIPNLLLAALFVAILGVGEATGVIAIAVFTFGMVSQLIYQAIETIDYAPVEAAEAAGANKVQIAIWAIAPQILGQVISYSFYALEVNVRASAVLGYVGAGGIGVILNSSLALMKYERVSIIILTILVVVVVVGKISEVVRREVA